MLTQSAPVPSFPDEFSFSKGSAFAVNLDRFPVPAPLADRVRNGVGKYHAALDSTKAATRLLSAAGKKIGEVEDTREQYSADGVKKILGVVRDTVASGLQAPRKTLRSALQDIRELRAALTLDSLAAEHVMQSPQALATAMAAVQLLPASALPQAAKQAAESHNLLHLLALHRHAATADISDDVRAKTLQVLNGYVEPARAALVHLEVQATRLWAYTEAGVDSVAAWPGVPDAMRALSRSNGTDVTPALVPESGTVLDARALLNAANAPQPIVTELQKPEQILVTTVGEDDGKAAAA